MPGGLQGNNTACAGHGRGRLLLSVSCECTGSIATGDGLEILRQEVLSRKAQKLQMKASAVSVPMVLNLPRAKLILLPKE